MFKHKPIEVRKSLVKAMVARMAQAYGVQKKELPKTINCQKAVINNWAYYGRIPYDHLDQCHTMTGVTMDWLLYGQLPRFNITQQKHHELQTIINKLFVDGEDFNIIKQCYPGATKQLRDKLEKDLLQWLGEDNTQEVLTKKQQS